MIILIYLLLILNLFSSHVVESQQQRNFDVEIKSDGTYNLLVKNKTWLLSANTFMRSNYAQYDTYSKTLILQSVKNAQGTDILGSWKSVIFTYALNNDTATTMDCYIVIYDNVNLVRFIQVIVQKYLLSLHSF